MSEEQNNESIVYDDGRYPELDDYYWRACFRLAMAYHYGQGTEKDLDMAIDLMSSVD